MSTNKKALPIEVSGVSHSFHARGKDLPVLQKIDLSIAAGEFVALLGPSGCGKSTLLRFISGLDAPTAGTIREGAKVVDGPSRERILMFQDPTLFPWLNVADNVGLGLDASGDTDNREARIARALSLVRLDDFASAFPRELSGGMAQRAAIARALVNEPPVLLLDEPLGKLDSLTRVRLQDELLALWAEVGFTAVLVTHDVEEALILADRIVVLSERPARIVADIRVGIDRPRHRDDPEFVRLRRDVLGHIGKPADAAADVPSDVAAVA